jgi:hypothetical protein
MSEDPAKQKEELLKGLDDAEREAKRIAAAAKETLQNARLMSDACPQLRTLFQEMPISALSSSEWVRQNQNMKSWLEVAKSMPKLSEDVALFRVTTQAATNTSVSGVTVWFALGPSTSTHPSGSPPYPPVVHQASKRLADIVETYPSLDKTREQIRRLGLDSRGGDSKSALQLLEEARATLDAPVVDDGSASGALLALRECINTCVSELVRRRPHQEQAKTWKAKMVSLGRQCGLANLAVAHFDNLGIEAENTNDQLSEAKSKQLSRPEVRNRFAKGLLFLASFLSSINEAKLRPA